MYDFIGVYLSVNGTILANNSKLSITMIGEEAENALLCFTDIHQFYCDNYDTLEDVGQWYFPNGSAVEIDGDMYMSRGLDVVRLHRRNNTMMPTGVFVCEIRDASGTNQSIYIIVSRPFFANNMIIIIGVTVSAASFLILTGFVLTILGIHRCYRASKCTRTHSNTINMKVCTTTAADLEIELEENVSYQVSKACRSDNNVQNTDEDSIYEQIID